MKLIRLLVLCLLSSSSLAFAAKTLDIYFIDTELGNAVLVQTPSGQAMMFDTGQPGDAFVDRVLQVIRLAGVKQLDYVIVSHYHWDHFGTIPELAQKIPILNYVDHGPDVNVNQSKEYYERYGGGPVDKLYDDYAKTRDSGNAKHIVPHPGDRLPMKDVDVRILTSAGKLLPEPLPGAGAANPACALAGLRSDDTSEDGQSISKLLTYGKFRYVDFGDLTWNKEYRLFCPENMVGTADVYVITHHGISQDMKAAGVWEWGRASAPPPEIRGVHPRVAVLLSREDYVGRVSTPQAWRDARSSPGLEDIWQVHYQAQGGKRNNAPEQFIANLNTVDCQAHYIKLSAELDGSFTMTNSRNGFTRHYAARAAEGKK